MNKDMTAEQIDTDAIMAEIRERIKTRDYKPMDLSFRDVGEDEMTPERIAAMTEAYNEAEYARQLQCMEEFCDVEYSRYKNKGGVSGFVKKIIRRLATCAVLPVVEQINAFHGASLEAQMQAFNYVRAVQGERGASATESVSDSASGLEKRIEELFTIAEKQNRKIESLIEENKTLAAEIDRLKSSQSDLRFVTKSETVLTDETTLGNEIGMVNVTTIKGETGTNSPITENKS